MRNTTGVLKEAGSDYYSRVGFFVWSVLLIFISVLRFCFACLRYMPCAQYYMHSCL